MRSGFQFTTRAYGVQWQGIGYAFGWEYVAGQEAALASLTPRQAKRAALRMRRAWEQSR